MGARRDRGHPPIDTGPARPDLDRLDLDRLDLDRLDLDRLDRLDLDRLDLGKSSMISRAYASTSGFPNVYAGLADREKVQ